MLLRRREIPRYYEAMKEIFNESKAIVDRDEQHASL